MLAHCASAKRSVQAPGALRLRKAQGIGKAPYNLFKAKYKKTSHHMGMLVDKRPMPLRGSAAEHVAIIAIAHVN